VISRFLKIAAGKFSKNEGVDQNLSFLKEWAKATLLAAEMTNPNRSIGEDHHSATDRRRGTDRSFGWLP
jgi:hypothetical protein